MIIKRIILENIRSYVRQDVTFPEGSLVLSGDIGSGKSSILLAIEFAIFGIKRGTLDGNMLLRQGTTQGSVELWIEIDGSKVVVKRQLKRTADSVVQEAGYIVVDEQKFEGTAQELRAKMLELLGYPKGLVTKSKDLLYRYTVYTPQEEMKAILFESKETRLETLRKLFNIDKYRRIRQNAMLELRAMKERIQLLEGKSQDVNEKEKQQTALQARLNQQLQSKEEVEPKAMEKKRSLQQTKHELEECDRKLNTVRLLKTEIEHIKTRKEDKKKQLQQQTDEQAALDKEIVHLEEQWGKLERQEIDLVTLENELLEKEKLLIGQEKEKTIVEENLKFVVSKLEETQQEIAVKEKEVVQLEEKNSLLEELTSSMKEKEQVAETYEVEQKKQYELEAKLTELKNKKEETTSLIKNIATLKQCPTCLQNVTIYHKKHITSLEQENVRKLDDQVTTVEEMIQEQQQKVAEMRTALDAYEAKEAEIQAIEADIKVLVRTQADLLLKKKLAERYEEEKNVLEEKTAKFAEESLEELRSEIEGLRKQIQKYHEQSSLQKQIHDKRGKKVQLEQQSRSLNQEVITLQQNITQLSADLEKNAQLEETRQRIAQQVTEKEEHVRKLEISIAEMNKEIEGLQQQLQTLQQEISEKKEAKESIAKLQHIQYWIEESFIKLMGIMERHVLAKVHREFNHLFKEWFAILAEDEMITAQLDSEFTPQLRQNGHVTNVHNLSGGEKTSIALAYRLALNKVTNKLMSSVKTKDVIILDEPTDGFSREQMDKIRDVLQELQIRQCIIVSHEPKIESFVDNVMRVTKEGHISSIEA